jgi:hypothetical protein
MTHASRLEATLFPFLLGAALTATIFCAIYSLWKPGPQDLPTIVDVSASPYAIAASAAAPSRLPSARSSLECNWAEDDASPPCKESSNAALRRVAVLAPTLARLVPSAGTQNSNASALALFGKGWGGHHLVAHRDSGKPQGVTTPCVFYSYGISTDYSFDTQIARDWACDGFLFDPTVVYPAKMEAGLRFFNVGAPLLSGSLAPGPAISPPLMMAALEHAWLNVLKMDCEGCEYAVARDVARFRPDFFSKVGQFALEVHVARKWLNDTLHLHYLGLLYHMLFAQGFELVHSTISGCMPANEKTGCMSELDDIGMPCGIGRSCHNLLFARPPPPRPD